jgi:hypothetical protein
VNHGLSAYGDYTRVFKGVLAVTVLFLNMASPLWGQAPANTSEAKPTLPDKELHFASDREVEIVSLGRLEDVKLLLQRGMDPNSRNTAGQPLLAIAIERKDPELLAIVKTLVAAGATIRLENEPHNNPLLMAITHEQPEVVKFLLEQGADFTARDAMDNTPLMVAEYTGNRETIALLEVANDELERREKTAKSDGNFQERVNEYAYYSCSHAYTKYYLLSDQDKLSARKKKEYETKLTKQEAALRQLEADIRSTFTLPQDPKRGDWLSKVRGASIDSITQELDEMVSNRFRKQQGVGKESDLRKRCIAIGERWKMRSGKGKGGSSPQ